jgi:RNA polymerase sigma-70 factor (ECF subfamily)
VSASSSDSIVDPALTPIEALSHGSGSSHSTVLALFDECATPLLRYVASFGLTAEETEDVVQDAFAALFRHLSLGRDRTNLRGWLFRVAHNQALKRREQMLRRLRTAGSQETALLWRTDPAPNPEAQLLGEEPAGGFAPSSKRCPTASVAVFTFARRG